MLDFELAPRKSIYLKMKSCKLYSRVYVKDSHRVSSHTLPIDPTLNTRAPSALNFEQSPRTVSQGTRLVLEVYITH
jgi:hypothetical protein